MKEVRYIRVKPNFRRIMRVKDFVALGIDPPASDQMWSAQNRFTVVMSNELSDSLVAKLPAEFMIMNELGDDDAPIDESASSDPQEQSDASEGDPDDDDESLTGEVDPEA